MEQLLTFVLGGGRGTRLYPLTKFRSKPAVPVAGKYRLVDIPLSNCLHSGFNRIYVLTQFNSVSLHRHIRMTYNFDPFSGGFVEILAAQQTLQGADWYQGTADAVRRHLQYLQQPGVDYALILSGDQLYRMDFRQMLQTHVDSGADVTIAALAVPREKTSQLGVMRVDSTGRVTGFLEKPQTDEELELVRVDQQLLAQRGVDTSQERFLASMGIYLFNRQTLVDALEKTDYQDFGKEIFPASIRTRHVQAHLFDGYWEDIGTIGSFYEANLALAGPQPPFDLHLEQLPIYSRPRFLPPSRVLGARVRNTLLADGCVIEAGAVIENSVIGLRCRIGREAVIRNSILMGSDFYPDRSGPGGPVPQVGPGSVIENAIVDKNCQIGPNVKIQNRQAIENGQETPAYQIRDGIVVVTKGAVIPEGTVI